MLPLYHYFVLKTFLTSKDLRNFKYSLEIVFSTFCVNWQLKSCNQQLISEQQGQKTVSAKFLFWAYYLYNIYVLFLLQHSFVSHLRWCVEFRIGQNNIDHAVHYFNYSFECVLIRYHFIYHKVSLWMDHVFVFPSETNTCKSWTQTEKNSQGIYTFHKSTIVSLISMLWFV